MKKALIIRAKLAKKKSPPALSAGGLCPRPSDEKARTTGHYKWPAMCRDTQASREFRESSTTDSYRSLESTYVLGRL